MTEIAKRLIDRQRNTLIGIVYPAAPLPRASISLTFDTPEEMFDAMFGPIPEVQPKSIEEEDGHSGS